MTEKPTRHFPILLACAPGQPDERTALCGYCSTVANQFTTSGKVTCPECLAKSGAIYEIQQETENE